MGFYQTFAGFVLRHRGSGQFRLFYVGLNSPAFFDRAILINNTKSLDKAQKLLEERDMMDYLLNEFEDSGKILFICV